MMIWRTSGTRRTRPKLGDRSRGAGPALDPLCCDVVALCCDVAALRLRATTAKVKKVCVHTSLGVQRAGVAQAPPQRAVVGRRRQLLEVAYTVTVDEAAGQARAVHVGQLGDHGRLGN